MRPHLRELPRSAKNKISSGAHVRATSVCVARASGSIRVMRQYGTNIEQLARGSRFEKFMMSGIIARRALISHAHSGRGVFELTRWHSCLSPCRTPAVAQTRAQGIRRRRAVARVPFLDWRAVRADATHAIHRIFASI